MPDQIRAEQVFRDIAELSEGASNMRPDAAVAHLQAIDKIAKAAIKSLVHENVVRIYTTTRKTV